MGIQPLVFGGVECILGEENAGSHFSDASGPSWYFLVAKFRVSSPLGGSSQDGRKWLKSMVSFRPLTGFIPLPNGLFMAYKWRLLLSHWDDPPSSPQGVCLKAGISCCMDGSVV